MRHITVVRVLLGAAVAIAPAAGAQGARQLDSATLAGFRWRNIGPANMMGRVADIAGIPSPSRTFYVAAAGGGIWKTTNAGTTFRPIFDHERVVSMGALAIAPSDTNIVWAGTGEQNTRNSISPGGGIYKSTDGGMHWTLMGLVGTQQIARIVVNPTNPDIVYVAALGHAWEPNKERGLYKTTDGGKTWKLIKFISDRAGFIDVAMDPSDPNTLYASSYERIRGPWYYTSGGPGSALWKTTDAGATWTKIQGHGFPTTTLGRIGIAISHSDPKIVYALVEADSTRGAKAPFPVPLSDSGKTGADRHNRLLSGLYRSADGGATWRWMNGTDVRPFYYSQVRVDPAKPDRVYWSSTPVNFSDDGGRTVRRATIGIHVDHHAMWIDPNDPEHFIVGDDGGVSQTWDRGGNYEFLNRIAIGQLYEVTYDFEVPYRVCGGLQDNGSWCGPSRKKDGPITNDDWFTVGGGDGFYTAQDSADPNIIYAESQGGGIGRLDYRTGERTFLQKPSWHDQYLRWEDSILVARGDTTRPETAAMKKRIAELRARQKADSIALDLRYNWDAPYFISPHASNTLYIGANRVLESTDRGDHIAIISPDLTYHDTTKIRISTKTTGGVTVDATGAETYATITTLAESYVQAGRLWAGTDDGKVWMSPDDGGHWEDLTGRFPGVPAHTYVVRIEPSHFDSLTAYVAFDGHRTNDLTPYLYVTTDGGRTFRSIAAGLPTGGPDFLHVVREDPANRDLLFVGTDVGAYVSRDRGAHWQRFMDGLPTVPVHDLKIQPRDHDLIAATHGRAIWIVNIGPLEQMTDSVLASGAHLFAPATAFQFGESPQEDIEPGQAVFHGQSAPYGADIAYSLPSGDEKDTVKLVVTDVKGDTVTTLRGPARAGLHHVTWDFRGKAPPSKPLSPAALRDSIASAHKIARVLDSLETAQLAPKPAIERVRKVLLGGGSLFSLFRRGGPPMGGAFQERPAESPLPPKRPEGGAPAGRGRPAMAGRPGPGAPGGGEIDMAVLSEIYTALREAGAIQPGFGRRERAPLVRTGDYLVTLTVGGQSQHQVLRVERVGLGDDATDAPAAGSMENPLDP